jgi:hypothetical protein
VWDELALSGDAALQLVADFLSAPLLDGIGATADKNRASNREANRWAFHPLILGIKPLKSIRQD